MTWASSNAPGGPGSRTGLPPLARCQWTPSPLGASPIHVGSPVYIGSTVEPEYHIRQIERVFALDQQFHHNYLFHTSITLSCKNQTFGEFLGLSFGTADLRME